MDFTRFTDLPLSQKCMYVAGGFVATAVTASLIKRLFKKDAKQVYPRDQVILHQVGRGPYAPSMTPFAVKLETYLRMAGIPYQNVHGFTTSSKGKFPWIEYNGEEVADTTIIIDFLNNKLGIDLNKNLSGAQKGIAQSMKVMAEEHLYWILVLNRWQYDNDKTMMFQAFKGSKFIFWLIQRRMEKQMWAQGLGRHTQGETTRMMKKDLQALSDILGDKPFLMGDVPCEEDCAVFGQLAQFYWQFIGTGHDTLIKGIEVPGDTQSRKYGEFSDISSEEEGHILASCDTVERRYRQVDGKAGTGGDVATVMPAVNDIRSILDQAGFFTNHSLRATCATRLFHEGIYEQLIARTGHRSNAIRQYKRVTDDQDLMVSSVVQGAKRQCPGSIQATHTGPKSLQFTVNVKLA